MRTDLATARGPGFRCSLLGLEQSCLRSAPASVFTPGTEPGARSLARALTGLPRREPRGHHRKHAFGPLSRAPSSTSSAARGATARRTLRAADTPRGRRGPRVAAARAHDHGSRSPRLEGHARAGAVTSCTQDSRLLRGARFTSSIASGPGPAPLSRHWTLGLLRAAGTPRRATSAAWHASCTPTCGCYSTLTGRSHMKNSTHGAARLYVLIALLLSATTLMGLVLMHSFVTTVGLA